MRGAASGGLGQVMGIYFLLHDATVFHRQLSPALAAAWRQHSFAPCRPLAELLLPPARQFGQRYHTAVEESVLFRLDPRQPFDRDIWRLLVGEALFYGAREIPEIETAPETLACLLAPERFAENEISRPDFPPIHQTLFGTRDLAFGPGYYRPEHAGWNDRADVARLSVYLDGIDPALWQAADLAALPGMIDEERTEELEFVRDWFGDLVDLYRRAKQRDFVIICETVQSPPGV